MKAIEKSYRVFLSSTYIDLRDERQAAMQTLLKMNCLPVGMELFPSGPDVWELIQELIDKCDLFILITADRYGSTSDLDGKSFTEREYLYALEQGKPIRAYPYNGTLPHKPELQQEDLEKREKLNKFHQLIQRQIVNPWSNTPELKANIAIDLAKFLPTLNGGWTQQRYGAFEIFADEINTLQSKFESEEVRNLNATLRSVIQEFQFSHSRNRLLKLGEILPWLDEREWNLLSDFARAQVRVRSSGGISSSSPTPLNKAMQRSIVDMVNHYEDQLINFEHGILEIEGELIEKVSGYFVSAVQEKFLALSNDDFSFWNSSESQSLEYYKNNLELIQNGVIVKRIFVIPKSKFKYPDVHEVIHRQISDKILVSIIGLEDIEDLIPSKVDRDFAIHDNFAVSFFRNYYGRIYKVDTTPKAIKHFKTLHEKVANYSQQVPGKEGKNKRIFETKEEFDLWLDRLSN